MQRAIPDTMADMMKMTGINGVIQSAFALTEPKMKPCIPVEEAGNGNADCRKDLDRLLVPFQGFFTDVIYTQGQRTKDNKLKPLHQAFVLLLLQWKGDLHKMFSVKKPEF